VHKKCTRETPSKGEEAHKSKISRKLDAETIVSSHPKVKGFERNGFNSITVLSQSSKFRASSSLQGKEILQALLSMDGDKALGPDNFLCFILSVLLGYNEG
jgi:hypothetical protein